MTTGDAQGEVLAQVAEESPAMLWRGDAEGRCVWLNRAMREFWGLPTSDCSRFDWSSSLLAEDAPAVFGPFAEGMAERQGFVCQGRYRRADGAIRVLRTRSRPCFDATGVFLGMAGVNEDVTDEQEAEAALRIGNAELAASLDRLREQTERFALAARISGLAMSEHDEGLRYVWGHNVPDACLGLTPASFLGPELGAPIEAILARTFATGEVQTEQLSVAVGDTRAWFDIQAAPSMLRDGRPGVVASALDVTARKLNEEKLEVLATELGHRVKNVFAVVQAIVRQSARATRLPTAFVTALEARLSALATAQDALLTLTDDRFDLGALLRRQLSHLDPDAIAFEGVEVLLPGRLAPYVALAAHELGTNALKYGALSVPSGRVSVTWAEVEPHRIRLTWAEQGGPPPATAPGKGFGSTLLTRVFAAAVGGTSRLDMDPAGLVWVADLSTKPEIGAVEGVSR